MLFNLVVQGEPGAGRVWVALSWMQSAARARVRRDADSGVEAYYRAAVEVGDRSGQACRERVEIAVRRAARGAVYRYRSGPGRGW